MKLKNAAVLVSSALLAGGMALAPPVQAQDSNIFIVGAPPTYVDHEGRTVVRSDMHMKHNGKVMVTGAGGPMTVMGLKGNWVPGVDVPVVGAVVMSQDSLRDKAFLKTRYGYVAVSTGAGATVLYKDRLISWAAVAPGQVVQLPLSDIVDGPIPHRVRVRMPMTSTMTMTMMNLSGGAGMPGMEPMAGAGGTGMTTSTMAPVAFTASTADTGVNVNVTAPSTTPDQIVAVVFDPTSGTTDSVVLPPAGGTAMTGTMVPADDDAIVTVTAFDANGNVVGQSRQLLPGTMTMANMRRNMMPGVGTAGVTVSTTPPAPTTP